MDSETKRSALYRRLENVVSSANNSQNGNATPILMTKGLESKENGSDYNRSLQNSPTRKLNLKNLWPSGIQINSEEISKLQDIDQIRSQLKLLTDYEEILNTNLNDSFLESKITVGSTLNSINNIHSNVNKIVPKFQNIINVLEETATLAKNVSTSVRDIDDEQFRVKSIISLIDDIQILKQSALGAKLAYDRKNIEEGARNIHQYLSYTPDDIKRITDHIKLFDISYLYGSDYSNFHSISSTENNNNNNNNDVLKDNQIDESSPLNALQNMDKYKNEFLKLNDASFQEAVNQSNDNKIVHYFFIYPLLGYREVGLDKFSSYICSQLDQQSKSIIRQSLNTNHISPNTYASLLTQVFETVATIIDQQEGMLENSCGLGAPIYLLQRLQQQSDELSINIINLFLENYEFKRKISEIIQFNSHVKKHPGFLASLTSVTGLANDLNNKDKNDDKNGYDNVDIPISPKMIDSILTELALISSKIKIFIRFILIRSLEYIEMYDEYKNKLVLENEKVSNPNKRRKSSLNIFSNNNNSSDTNQLSKQPSLMSNDSSSSLDSNLSQNNNNSYHLVKIKQIPSLIEVKNYSLPTKSKTCILLKDLFTDYITMENYFLKQSTWKAMRLDSIDTGTSLTSTSLDDVFFIIRTSARRCLMSADCDCICSIINGFGILLEFEFIQVFQNRIKLELSKLTTVLDSIKSGNSTFATALGTVEGLTGTSNSSSSNSSEGTILDPNYSKKISWITWLNNMDVCCDYLTRLIDELESEILIIFNNDKTSSSLDLVISKLEKHHLIINNKNTDNLKVHDDNAMAIEKIKTCLETLKEYTNGFRKSSKTWIDNIFRQQIKPKLRTLLTSCYEGFNYVMTEEEYTNIKFSDRFSRRLYTSLRGIVEPCTQRLTEWNLRQMIADITDFLCKEWERILISSHQFNNWGALRLQKDIRHICNYLASASTADNWVRNRFTKLLEIANRLASAKLEKPTRLVSSNA